MKAPERPRFKTDMLLSKGPVSCSSCRATVQRGDPFIAEPVADRPGLAVFLCWQCGSPRMLAAWEQHWALVREWAEEVERGGSR